MKLNIEVELDWMEDGGNLDEEVQEQIINGVKNAISRDCLTMVEEKTKTAIDEGVSEAIKLMSKKVTDFFESWLDSEVTITDRYGDQLKEGSLRDIIKREFNDCMNQQVDSKGNPASGYGAKYSRLEFVTGKKVQEVVNDSLKHYGKDIDTTIKNAIDAGIKSRVSDKFAEMVIGYAKQDYKNATAIEQKT